MNRQSGYYWVKRGNVWLISDFGQSKKENMPWLVDGHAVSVDFFSEINERPIIRYEDLPKTFDVKKGIGIERHLLENYYVALPPLPIPDAETVQWITIEKGSSIGKSGGFIEKDIKP